MKKLLFFIITFVFSFQSLSYSECKIKFSPIDADKNTFLFERKIESKFFRTKRPFYFRMFSGSNGWLINYKCKNKKKKFYSNQNLNLLKQTFIYYLYTQLSDRYSREFYRAIFYRKNFIHPLSYKWFDYELKKFNDLIKYWTKEDIVKYRSNYYFDFGKEGKIIKKKEQLKTKNYICKILKEKPELIERPKIIEYFSLFDKKIYSIPETLKSLDTEYGQIYARFYEKIICENKDAKICLDKNANYHLNDKCKNYIFMIEYDHKKKKFSSKLNIDDINQIEKKLILSLYKEKEDLSPIENDLNNLNYYLLDLDYLWYFQYLHLLNENLGLNKFNSFLYILGDYRARYSKSYFLPFSHGHFAPKRGNPFLFSMTRITKEASCVARAVHAFLLSSIFFDSKLQYILYSDKIGHAIDIFKYNHEKYVVDNSKPVKYDHLKYSVFCAARQMRKSMHRNKSIIRKVTVYSKDLFLLKTMNRLYTEFYKRNKKL